MALGAAAPAGAAGLGGGTAQVTYFTINIGDQPGTFGPAILTGTFVLGTSQFTGQVTTGTADVFNDDPSGEGFGNTTIAPFAISGNNGMTKIAGTCSQPSNFGTFKLSCSARIGAGPLTPFTIDITHVGVPRYQQVGTFTIS